MPDPDPTLLRHDSAPIRIWLHPALEHRQSLERLIDAYGGVMEESSKSSQVALVDTSLDTYLSEKTYSTLVLESNSVVDPSWLLDSIEYGAPLDDEPYTISTAPHSTFTRLVSAASNEEPEEDPNNAEKLKESAEFFLKTVLDMGTNNWEVVYRACVKSPKSPNKDRDFWELINYPRGVVNCRALALTADAPENSDALFEQARKSYPKRYEDDLVISSPSSSSVVPRPSNPRSSRRVSSASSPEPPLWKSLRAGGPKSALRGQLKFGPYSSEETNQVKEIILRHREEEGFEPTMPIWWEQFENTVGRKALSMQKKFVASPLLRKLASGEEEIESGSDDCADKGGEGQGENVPVAGGSAIDSTPNQSKGDMGDSVKKGGPWSAAEVAILKRIILAERDKNDFRPRSPEWTNRFIHLLPGRTAAAIMCKCQDDQRLWALLPVHDRRQGRHLISDDEEDEEIPLHGDVLGEDPQSHLRNADDDNSSPLALRAKSLSHDQQSRPVLFSLAEVATIKSIATSQRNDPKFQPHSESSWKPFMHEFPGRTLASVTQKAKEHLRAVQFSPHADVKRKRSLPPPSTHNAVSGASLNSMYEDEEDADEEEAEESEEVLFAKLVKKRPGKSWPVWTRKEIEQILAVLHPITSCASHAAFESFDFKVHSQMAWHLKWAGNKELFRRLVAVRRRNAAGSELPLRARETKPRIEPSPPKKRFRREPSPAQTDHTPSPSSSLPTVASSSRGTSMDPTKLLPLMIPRFVTYIQRKKPTTSRAILDMWTEISMEKEFRALNATVDDLMPIYYTKQQIFAPILDGL